MSTGTEGLEALVRWCAPRYQEALKAHGLLDFTDIITQSTELLQAHADLQRHYSQLYSYVLVDEFQDVSLVQFAFLKALTSQVTTHTPLPHVHFRRPPRPYNPPFAQGILPVAILSMICSSFLAFTLFA